MTEAELKEIEARYPSKSVMRRIEIQSPGQMAEDCATLINEVPHKFRARLVCIEEIKK